ncbi:Importin subunit beta [Portunus trituberculatus]|uniref:Importin subunit beta n=1 Tax=Portunus trituberculatus TaxID=210409 RepID=A0A5B7HQ16_PORTR|nr:Importin subunit beta [Portunus trituberculatus]
MLSLRPLVHETTTFSAIVHSMQRDEPSDDVRLAATTPSPLLSSLQLTTENLERDADRHFIMHVVCEAAHKTNTLIKRKKNSIIELGRNCKTVFMHCFSMVLLMVPYGRERVDYS